MIKIKKSSCADTRTCAFTKVTKKQLLENSKMHILDVQKGLGFLGHMLEDTALDHDYTKISRIGAFHKDFKVGFKTTDWYVMHQMEERHHFNNPDFIQEDVNLIDVLEQIVDGVMAGCARQDQGKSGFRKEDLPEGLLQKAYDNTVSLLLKQVEVGE